MNNSRRLIELYDSYIDNTLTSSQNKELVALLAHTEYQKEWRMLSYLEAKLQEEVGIAHYAGALTEDILQTAKSPLLTVSWTQQLIQRTGWWVTSFALHAACIFLAALWIIMIPEKPMSSSALLQG